jgi:RNA polymerase sigma factor (TIGR02999 family)
MADVTQILSQIESGDPSAADQLLPLIYEELRKLAAAKLAHEKPGQTLQATALVHEAYLRLVGAEKSHSWDSRGHFFSAAAEAMRRVLLNRVRDKKRQKRAGERQRISLDQVVVAMDTPAGELMEMDEAIEELANRDLLSANIVKLRFFAGLSLKDAADALGLTRRQADRHWAYARAWLFDRLTAD